MSDMNSDQLHRATLGIYSSLMDQFNPSLQRLVSLGNSYFQAFQAFAITSEAYFNALAKIGQQALHSMSSCTIGEILIQISESQRKLTMELEGVFSWFHTEVLQEMDNNLRLDVDYISSSRRRYEMEVRTQASALERQLRRGINKDRSEYMQFLRESQREALKEEERRYRFLAEKHTGITQSIVYLMNKTGSSLQQNAESWKEEANATRGREARDASRLDNMIRMREEERGQGREEPPLGRVPSRPPSPQVNHSPANSVSESSGGGGGIMRALLAHQDSSSSPNRLSFARGEIITMLVQQPRNGWLFGRAESTQRQGWFPPAYVEPLNDTPIPRNSSNSNLRGNNNMSNQLDQSRGSSYNAAPPPPPLPSWQASNKHSDEPSTTYSSDRRAETNTKSKRSQEFAGPPELFPKGTNPFATVKLKPTSTNDRSAPRLHR